MTPKMTRLHVSGWRSPPNGEGASPRRATPSDAQVAVVAVAVGVLVADALVGVLVLRRHFFSWTAWPPNSLRSAASTLPLNVSVWRERKRAKRAAEIAGIGTLCLIACSTVQRPSPVSST